MQTQARDAATQQLDGASSDVLCNLTRMHLKLEVLRCRLAQTAVQACDSWTVPFESDTVSAHHNPQIHTQSAASSAKVKGSAEGWTCVLSAPVARHKWGLSNMSEQQSSICDSRPLSVVTDTILCSQGSVYQLNAPTCCMWYILFYVPIVILFSQLSLMSFKGCI